MEIFQNVRDLHPQFMSIDSIDLKIPQRFMFMSGSSCETVWIQLIQSLHFELLAFTELYGTNPMGVGFVKVFSIDAQQGVQGWIGVHPVFCSPSGRAVRSGLASLRK